MNITERRNKVRGSSQVTGIDYVLVEADDQSRPILQVFILGAAPSGFELETDQISITSAKPDATPSSIGITSAKPVLDGDDELVGYEIHAERVGELTPYVLRIDNEQIDRCFREKLFSFQAVCERDIDCRQPSLDDDRRDDVDFPVDYMARDFGSLRRALLEFAAQRYPRWGDPVEADVVVTLLEAMSALGDEFSYYQDRIAGEAHLETATQRRSVRRHARLVDYWPFEGRAASGWVTLDFDDDDTDTVLAGTRLQTSGASPRPFEVAESFQEILDERAYPVLGGRDELTPYFWCDDDQTLPAGATEMWVSGDLEDELGAAPAGTLRVLLVEAAPDASQSPRRWPVTIVEFEGHTDQLMGAQTTRIRWSEEEAIPFNLDLNRTVVRANLLPVIAGQTRKVRFIIGESPAPQVLPEAVERLGPDGTVSYRFTLPGSDQVPLAWSSTPHVALRSIPAAAVSAVSADDLQSEELDFSESVRWNWKPSFVFGVSSGSTDRDFVLEAGSWKRITAHLENGIEYPHVDYASQQGATIRFGDGALGQIPPRGTIFEVTYRLGNGTAFNVASHSIDDYVGGPTWNLAPGENLVDDDLNQPEVDNPLAIEGGLEEEDRDRTKSDAPYAFRTISHRAVRPGDYAEAAERLDWVHRAGARLRWTGSWSTLFASPDTRGAASLDPGHRRELAEHLDKVRQVGRPVAIREPDYVDLDLRIHLCVQPGFERSRVQRAVLPALYADPNESAQAGFLHPDRFTFGAPLDRTGLEAFLQAISGVKAVEDVEIRRQGWFDWRVFEELKYEVSQWQIIRISNDPVFPRRGTVQLFTHGGI